MGGLTEKQEAAITALLTEKTHVEAAKKAGIGEATLRRYLTQPEFVAAYRQARRAIVEDAVTALQKAATAAVKTLERNLDCGNLVVETRAAQLVLEQAFRGAELLDLAQRIEELEALVKNGAGNPDEEGGSAQGPAADPPTGPEPDPRPPAGGSHTGDEGDGADARPLAAGPAEQLLDPGIASLHEAGG
jgi:hypothetical protein